MNFFYYKWFLFGRNHSRLSINSEENILSTCIVYQLYLPSIVLGCFLSKSTSTTNLVSSTTRVNRSPGTRGLLLPNVLYWMELAISKPSGGKLNLEGSFLYTGFAHVNIIDWFLTGPDKCIVLRNGWDWEEDLVELFPECSMLS